MDVANSLGMYHSYRSILNAAPADRNHTNKMRSAETHSAPCGAASRRVPGLLFAAMLTLQLSCQSIAPPASLDTPAPTAPTYTPLDIPPLTPSITYQLQPNLWRDVRQSFELPHELHQRRVAQELRWLREHPNYLMRLQPRLQRYLGYIHTRVRARGLPGELALLPIVESALDPYAFSPEGAAGLWQFMPATGRRFGLRRDWWYDGRRDPVAATEAALDYLQLLHRRFGDWSLALAAYNAGEGTVQRAQRRGPAGASYWDLPLPRETRAYVPRLLALSALVTDPAAYGITLPVVVPEIPFSIVSTDTQIDIAVAAEHLEVELDTLYGWNPALNQWATPPSGPHRLMVPGGQLNDFEQKLASIPMEQRVHWTRIQVSSGDTLSELARRHRTDVSSLKKANNLRGNTIRIGQALYIPSSTRGLDNYPPARRAAGAIYVVRQGDSLWSISRAHGVSTLGLMKANQVGPKELLKVGQRLRIPGGREKVIRTVNYGVRPGDSLSKIAARFNVRVSDIASWNQLNVDRYLRPGQSLKLYVDVSAAD